MKTMFKKDIKIKEYLTLFITALVIMASGIWSTRFITILYIFWIILTIVTLRNYEITEKGLLKEGKRSIDIHTIYKIVDLPDGLDIYYSRKKKGTTKCRRFRPKDKATFITKLKEYNSKIQII